MPAKFEGILDQAHLEEVKLQTSQTSSWKPARAGRWSLDLVRPDFLSLRPSTPKITRTRPTAWLDGLRGFAAFLVYLHHNQLWSHDGKGNAILENAFGYEGRHYLVTLPFIRLFFAGGHFAVAIFFVISGYVLSVKALGQIQKGQIQAAADTIASALFRRWIRLYLPIIAVTLFWLCFRHWTGLWMDLPEKKETFRADLLHWYYMFKNYSFVFSGNVYDFITTYHQHLWSIPIEFKGSIIIYTTIAAFARCTKNARLWCEVALIFYFLYIVDGFYGALFMAGMLLCDLELLAQDEKLPKLFTKLSGFKEFIFFHLFVAGLYLGGVPGFDSPDQDRTDLLAKSPGWRWLSHLKPQAVFDAKWFYLFWAALFTVSSVPRLPWLKRFFETRFCQYFARISFALYLVHGPVLWSLGDRIYAMVGFERSDSKAGIPGWVNKVPLPMNGPMGFELAFWAAQLILFPVTLYAAEVVTKLIDEPSVKLANWLHRKTLAQQPSHRKSSSVA